MTTTAWDEATLTFPSGPMTVVVAADGEAVVGIGFGPAAAGPGLPGEAERDPAQQVVREAVSQLRGYAAGERLIFDLPVKLRGTEFQMAVWSALREIPYGETSTYGKVAAAIGRPTSVRAVGAAIGANPVGIVVPCHRVIGANGSLTGFAGGLDNKAALLARESVVL